MTRLMDRRLAGAHAWLLVAPIALAAIVASATSAVGGPDRRLPRSEVGPGPSSGPARIAGVVATGAVAGIVDAGEAPPATDRMSSRGGPRRVEADMVVMTTSSDRDADRLGDRFEVEASMTDPRSADTDRDGIRDGAEDPDGDRLSNVGEQLYGRDPLDPDTDDDLVDDWHEDGDGDGRADGMTQDRRRVPSGLRPPLGAAFDRPASHASCHQGQRSSVVLVCRVTRRGGVRVVLLGDSHALQWRGPLAKVAKARGWRVWVVTKSACQIADVATPNRTCRAWREAAIRKVGALDADIVIVGGHLRFVNDDGSIMQRRARQWREGMSRSLRRLDRVAGAVVLLGDTPRFGDVVRCLKRHPRDMSACSRRRDVAVPEARVAVERQAAERAGVRYGRTDHLTCPYDPCPAIIERTLVAYDQGHLTVRFATSLWRGLDRLLAEP